MVQKFKLSALLIAGLATSAQANIGPTFGFGPHAASLAGATVASPQLGFASAINPAGLETPDSQRLHFSTGAIFMHPEFEPITGVVIENNYVSDKTPPRYGEVDTNYRDTLGQLLGLSYVLDPESWRWTLGVTAFVPTDSIAALDSGEAFQPEYVLHRSRTQRPQVDFGFSARPSASWSIGFGLRLAYSISGTGSLMVQTNSSQPSSLRLSSSLKPKWVPFFGLNFLASEGTRLGLVIRAPYKSQQTLNLRSGARLLGTLPALDINLAASAPIFYDPLSIELGWTQDLSAIGAKLYLQVDYEAWSRYRPPALAIDSTETANCSGSACSGGVVVSGSKNPSAAFKDLWVPRIGIELTSLPLTPRVGYSYRGSILKALPSGSGNLLDPPRHIFAGGLTVPFEHFLHLPVAWSLDLAAQYHWLTHQTVTKTSGNEGGSLSDSKIGAPGYSAGGHILGGSIAMNFSW